MPTVRPAGESGVRLGDTTPTFLAKGETLRPLRDQIVVRPLKPRWSTIIDTSWHGETLRGTVVAVGPGCWPNRHSRTKKDGKEVRTVRKSAVFRPTEVKVGDTVELGGMEIGGYLWQSVLIDGVKHVICREQDVAAVHYESGSYEHTVGR